MYELPNCKGVAHFSIYIGDGHQNVIVEKLRELSTPILLSGRKYHYLKTSLIIRTSLRKLPI